MVARSAMRRQVQCSQADDMFRMNSAVMGFNQSVWMAEVLGSLDAIVSNVSISNRVKEETDVPAIRVSEHDAALLAVEAGDLCARGSLAVDERCAVVANTFALPPNYEAAL